jgi:hypothetical protein
VHSSVLRSSTKDPPASSSKQSTQRTTVPLRSSSPTPPSSSASRSDMSKSAKDSDKFSELIHAKPLVDKDVDTVKRLFEKLHGGETMGQSVNPDYVE